MSAGARRYDLSIQLQFWSNFAIFYNLDMICIFPFGYMYISIWKVFNHLGYNNSRAYFLQMSKILARPYDWRNVEEVMHISLTSLHLHVSSERVSFHCWYSGCFRQFILRFFPMRIWTNFALPQHQLQSIGAWCTCLSKFLLILYNAMPCITEYTCYFLVILYFFKHFVMIEWQNNK